MCLPAAGQALVDGKICTVTGWGNTQYYGESHPLPGKPPCGETDPGQRRAVWQVWCLLALGHRDTEEPGVGTRRGGGCACSPALPSLARTPPGQQAGVLQEARVPIISNDVCNGPDFYGNQIKPKMFCAGYLEGGIDACQVRDGGGPPLTLPPERWRHRAVGGQAPDLRARGLCDHSPWPSESTSSLAAPSPTRATVVAPSCVRTASLGPRVGGSVAL